MKKIILITLPLILFGCSASYHIKKAIAKDPSILEKDTIVFTDSVHVVTKEVTHDSVFQVSKDTVVIKKDKLTIKHFYHNDSVWIYGECASDTIVKWKKFEVVDEKIVYNESWFPKWMWWIIGILVLLFILKKIFPTFFK